MVIKLKLLLIDNRMSRHAVIKAKTFHDFAKTNSAHFFVVSLTDFNSVHSLIPEIPIQAKGG
jgi:hypothetical protein